VLNVNILLLIRGDRAHIGCHEDVFSGRIILALKLTSTLVIIPFGGAQLKNLSGDKNELSNNT